MKTKRDYRTRKEGSIIFESGLSAVLNDFASYAFVAVLYGSISSFNYSRILIAHALLDYSEIYSDGDLAYEGVKLLALAGEASEFTAQFNNGEIGLSNVLKTNADDLWMLSGKGITVRIPAMRCTLARQAVPYFSDGVFSNVEEYVSSDLTLFSRCRHEWLGAINEVKLRMNGAVLANLILKVLSEKLYTLAPDLGRIIAGSNFDAFPKDLLEAIACYLKKHASELLEGNMQLSAFAAKGSYLGEDLVGQPLTDSLNEIERNEYLQGLSQGDKSAESYAKELVRQFISNNVTGRYTHPAYSVGDSIYDLMNKKASDEFDGKTLNGIVGQITDYKGFSVALDEPLAVPCRYVCMLRSNRRELPSNQREQIEAIDENRYRI